MATLETDKLNEEIKRLQTILKQVKQHNRDMMNILHDVEWLEALRSCPWCGYREARGHDYGCKLDEVLHGKSNRA